MILEKLKKIKNKKRFIIITTTILCVLVIGFSFYNNVISTAVNYKAAVAFYDDEEYIKAYDKFNSLGDYKDSKEYAQKCLNNQKESDFKKALDYMDNKEYEKAKKILKSLGDYQGSDELADKCTGLIELEKQHAKTDPLYNAYYTVAKEYFKNYGKPVIKKDPDNKKSYTVVGVNILILVDLNNDNVPELIVGGKETASSSGEYAVYTFKGSEAEKVNESAYNHHSGYYAFELCAAENSKYNIYSGNTDEGKLLSFNGADVKTELNWENNADDDSAAEKIYIINGKNVSKNEYLSKAPRYNVTEITSGFKSPFSTYTIQYDNYTIYPNTHMTKSAASNLKSTCVMQQYEIFKESNKRIKEAK